MQIQCPPTTPSHTLSSASGRSRLTIKVSGFGFDCQTGRVVTCAGGSGLSAVGGGSQNFAVKSLQGLNLLPRAINARAH